MTDTKPNAELAWRVLDHIDAHPENWDQRRWWCGTGGCFAGWTVQLAGEDPDEYLDPDSRPVHVSTRAAQLLGFRSQYNLDDAAEEALDSGDCELFSSYNNRENLGRIVEAVFGPRPGGTS